MKLGNLILACFKLVLSYLINYYNKTNVNFKKGQVVKYTSNVENEVRSYYN